MATLTDTISEKAIEAIVVAILTSTFAFLLSLFFTKRPTKFTASAKLESLCARAKRIDARLHDAEQNRQIEDQSVLRWLSELRSIASEIGDMDDEFQTRSQLCSTSVPPWGWFSYISVRCRWHWHCWRVHSRVEEINKKYNDLFEDRRAQMLPKCEAARLVRSAFNSESGSLRVQGPSQFHGRSSEKTILVGLLLRSSNNTRNFPVISINGVGGIGKTALAQSVFSDKLVTDRFDLRIWLSLSSHPDPVKTTQKIIQNITTSKCNLSSLDALQTTLCTLLKDQTVLLVLDGLWTEDPSFWDTIRAPFNSALPGSKILVTSRNQVASQYVGTSEPILLRTLDTASLWLVLKNEAFPQASESYSVPENLQTIGKKIVRKCDGSPLAAKLLGKALCNSLNEELWETLLNDMPDPSEVVQNILPSLKLSYELLPLHLKRCFAYCAIFPKNYEFDPDDLVKLWVSEDLINPERPRPTKVKEDIGRKQFTDLQNRSFFQPSDGNSRKYVMPGAIHDLAQSVSEYKCLRVDHLGIQHGRDKRATYALLVGDHNRADSVNHIYERKSLRTFILYNESCIPIKYLSPNQLVKKLKYLRSLDLSHKKLKKLPSSIKNLILLRYLNLRGSLFEELPESICELLNLQTLELGDCCKLKRLPRKLSKLVNIRHIGLGLKWEKWDGEDFNSMPSNLGNLSFLQTLSRFAVSRGDESRISELGRLDLRGELCISNLENVRNGDEAREARLNEKKHIEFLMLKGSEGKGFNEDVMESLKPVETIKSIYIECYNGSTLPNWMEDPVFEKVETVRLSKCKDCVKLPQLGKLHKLKTLYIQGLDKVTDLNDLLCASNGDFGFKSLEVLHISDMPELKTWFDLPNDRLGKQPKITISNCPKLERASSSATDSDPPALSDPVVEITNSRAIHWIRNLNYVQSVPFSYASLPPNSHLVAAKIVT